MVGQVALESMPTLIPHRAQGAPGHKAFDFPLYFEKEKTNVKNQDCQPMVYELLEILWDLILISNSVKTPRIHTLK